MRALVCSLCVADAARKWRATHFILVGAAAKDVLDTALTIFKFNNNFAMMVCIMFTINNEIAQLQPAQ